MKKAEIIKIGNVNLKPIKKIDLKRIELDYWFFIDEYYQENGEVPAPARILDWFKKILS